MAGRFLGAGKCGRGNIINMYTHRLLQLGEPAIRYRSVFVTKASTSPRDNDKDIKSSLQLRRGLNSGVIFRITTCFYLPLSQQIEV